MVNVLRRKFRNLVSDHKFSEILTGSVFALGAKIGATLLALITSVIIARFYGPEMMGILAMINSVVVLVTIFTVLGTNISILRLIPEHAAKYSATSAFYVYRKTQYFVIAVSLASAVMLFFASGIIAEKVFSKPHLAYYFMLAAGFVVFKSVMDLNTHAVRGMMLIKTFAFMQILPVLAKLVILLAAILLFPNPNNAVYAQFAAWAVAGIVGAWIMNYAFSRKRRPEDTIQFMSLNGIMSISLPMLMTTSMTFAIGQTGVILLGMFTTESEVGYYSVAVKLASLTAFILQAINSMAAPKFSELFHAGKMDDLFYVARKSTCLIFWSTVPILLGLVAFGRPILRILFGAEFTVAYPAMVFLVLGQFVNSVSGSTGYFMNMTGHESAYKNVILLAAVVNIALSLALIPHFGMNGAAFSGMISMSLWNVLALAYIKEKLGRSIGYLPLITR